MNMGYKCSNLATRVRGEALAKTEIDFGVLKIASGDSSF